MQKLSFLHSARFTSICFLAAICAPHLFLDFHYFLNGKALKTTNFQYYFFIINLVSISLLLNGEMLRSFSCIFRNKILISGCFLFLLGIFISDFSFSEGRLLLIWICCSLPVVYLGFYTYQQKIGVENAWFVLFIFPIIFPVIYAVFFEIFGPIDVGYILQNMKDETYSFPRWHSFHASANGFGLDAALGLTASIFGFIYSKSKVSSVIYSLIAVGCLVCLIMSGTRSAFLMALFVLIFVVLNFNSVLRLIYVLTAFMLLILAVSVFLNIDVVNFLRLEGKVDVITSDRAGAIATSLKLLLSDPFIGYGFGEAGKTIPVKPSNLFYFILPLEIGIFGLIGAIVLMLEPIITRFQQVDQKFSKVLTGRPSPMHGFTFSCLLGLPIWLVFEFDIFRISATNQIYMLCFGYALAHNCQESVNSIYSSSPRVTRKRSSSSHQGSDLNSSISS